METDYISKTLKRAHLERDEDWHGASAVAADLTFQGNWKVRIIPPWAGAMARFVVSKGDKKVSVYFDTDDRLGCMDKKPYYEIYPAADGETARFYPDEADEMMLAIRKSLNRKAPCSLD